MQGYEQVEYPEATIQQSVGDGVAASAWRVDTSSIRQLLEYKLKGIVERSVEYTLYDLVDADGKELTQFLAIDDDEAMLKLNKYCDMKNVPIISVDFVSTKETQHVVKSYRTTPLIPDEVCDKILASIDVLFSQVGYLTKFDSNDIVDNMYRNITEIRTYLTTQFYKRDDMDKGNFGLVINLIENMVYPVLKASEGGYTAHQIGQQFSERVVTHADGKKTLGLF